MQKHLDSERQYLDRKVAAGQLTQEKADGLHQERKDFLTNRLNKPESSVSTTQSKQDSAGVMYDRGVKYANGLGVPQNDVQAYMWYSLAAARLTGVQQRFAADGRDYVASRMTPAQLAEAQRLAQQCQAQDFKGC